jgi:2-polyprenyl-3-methyl-5-hydroxy-6-metoxy-1,4-benzoquinol methylase
MSTERFQAEVSRGVRFEFGKNWRSFLSVLNDERIAEAERSLVKMLGVDTLVGRSFLDVGSGSGLFSLAAMRLRADKVHSVDYDPQSVACTVELKRRYFRNDDRWVVEQGSALDVDYLRSLGQWDVVYSWGVLHHTGDMWKALDNVAQLVKPGGRLFISIYNDQGALSKFWRAVKALYNRGAAGRRLVTLLFVPYFVGRGLVMDLLRHKNPVRSYTDYKRSRGMSRLHDLFDWLGGYPFEVASPEAIFGFYRDRGYVLTSLKTCKGGSGCNEYVFTKS